MFLLTKHGRMLELLALSAWAVTISCPTKSADVVGTLIGSESQPSVAATDHSQHTGLVPEPKAHDHGMSLYELESQWTDQSGTIRDLSSFRGKRQLIAMVYTNCSYACPRIIGNMKRIEAAVPDVGFIIVSIDPGRDTPEKLADFAKGSRLDMQRYTLLHGDDAQLLELAAALNVRYRKTSEGEFVHTNVITVLDEKGNIVHRQEGFDAVNETIAFLNNSHSGARH